MRRLLSLVRKYKAELGIFLVSLCIYAATSARSIVQGDAGDFLATAAIGGIPHDPGYPLYSLFARIAFQFPFGNPSWQVNLLSALFASITLVLVYKISKNLTSNTFSALFSAIVLGTFQSFWFYALTSEIHVLQVLILSFFVYSLFSFIDTRKALYLNLVGFSLGLGVSNNHTIIFMVPVLIIALLYLKKIITLKKLLVCVFFFGLGLLPYLYILFAAYQNPLINWGGVRDVVTFIRFVLRVNYGTFNLAPPEPELPFVYSPFVHFFKSILASSWPIALLAAVSFFKIRKKTPKLIILALAFMLTGPVYYLLIKVPVRSIIHEANTEQYISYSFFFLCILSGAGLVWVLRHFRLLGYIPIGLAIIVLAITFFNNLSLVRQDNNRLSEVLTKFQLNQVPKGSVLITFGDSPFMPIMYWQFAENYRTDVMVIAYGLYHQEWYRKNLVRLHPELKDVAASKNLDFRKLCRQFASNNRLYITPWYPDFEVFFKDSCKLIPYGLVTKVVTNEANLDLNAIKRFNEDTREEFEAMLPPLSEFSNKYSRTEETLFRLSEQYNYTGIFYLNNARIDWAQKEFEVARKTSRSQVNAVIGEASIWYQKKELGRSIELLELGKRRAPYGEAFYKNLGVIYNQVGEKQKAYQNFKEYLNFNPSSDPDIIGIRNFVRVYEGN